MVHFNDHASTVLDRKKPEPQKSVPNGKFSLLALVMPVAGAASPARSGYSALRGVWILAVLLSTLLAALFDAAALLRHWHTGHTIIAGDFISFRQDAIAAARHLASDSLPYPPPFMLLSTPFSVLPMGLGYFAWELAGLLCLLAAAVRLNFRPNAMALGLLSPPVLYCLTMGQTGLFVSAVLLLSLGLADGAPILAGIAAGAVIIKPQFGLLLPVCFIASQNWKALAAAAATVFVLCLLPVLLFGLNIWVVYFPHHVSGATSLISTPWPARFEYTMVSPFMMCRSLGAGFAAASCCQGVASLGAAGVCGWLWHSRVLAKPDLTAATLCLIMLATPYAYIYDLPALAIIVAEYAARHRPRALEIVAVFWFFTGFYPLFSTFWFLPGPVFITLILLRILNIENHTA